MNATSFSILTVEIRYEHDVVLSRQRARQIAEILGFDRQDQVRLATAVSEMARNAFRYAGSGKVEFVLLMGNPQGLEVSISDQGKGIRNLQSILNEEAGTGSGIISAKRLMDDFRINSTSSGTKAVLRKALVRSLPDLNGAKIGEIAKQLATFTTQDPFAEIQRQNQDLLATMAELEKRQQELSELNRELEDTNRGVVALYAELDQRADYLRRISESKTRFLSNMTHEFRTPLNSILSISRMLADRLDGELNAEQAKQVTFIRAAAGDLAQIVDDLLDLAKVESGKAVARPTTFELKSLFAALKGTLRPLLSSDSSVSLFFEEPGNIPLLHTDESKLSQILRNFISNALKYTAKGEVRVRARLDGADFIELAVIDTGIGIAPSDQERIFEEFEQIEGAHQTSAKGTGLGLPLAKSLAQLLGGMIKLQSEVGKGSMFSVRLPIRLGLPQKITALTPRSTSKQVLIVDDDEASRYVLKQMLSQTGFQIEEALSGKEGMQKADSLQPSVIFLDLGLPDMDGELLLRELKKSSNTYHIPVIVNTSRELNLKKQAELLTLAVGLLFKSQIDFDVARQNLHALLGAVAAS